MAFIAFLSPEKIKMGFRSFFKGIFKKMGVFIAFLRPEKIFGGNRSFFTARKNIWAFS
jgi:hypothetical protein